MSILFVFTSADKNLKGGQTGWYLPEAAHPYYVLAPHFKVDFASPKGANPPVDEGSVKNFTDKESVEFLKDETVKAKFTSAKKLSDVDAKDYDAIFYVGGHGPVLDLATDPVNIKLASDFYNAGKITSAVCHGPAALVGAQTTDGKSIFAGKKATGFSNVEEEKIEAVETIPFLLEDRIKYLGGEYIKTDPWQPKVVVDGHLITGQNPASALPLGEALLKALQSK
ncbi:class I glutamine amidotransferase-like protein [Gymnopus androsaceus JB14]|uniref:D-lactate dehydratase n=1 Tax=Gymnopus androsaceus JB14 TaxID=1447944 RepID=A0A6A4INU2_9AGAR|nr:class I glutamine amidotransferase-like protein [Gymnopus androsaceus JB14]